MKKERIVLAILLTAFIIIVTACSFGEDNSVVIGKDVLALKQIEKEQPTDKDGMIRISAVITGIDSKNNTITAKTIVLSDNSDYNSTQKEYSLKYTGGTDIFDKYGTVISASQLKLGEIVKVEYDSSADKIKKISEDGDYFEISGITGASINSTNHSITIGNKDYTFDNFLVVFDKDETSLISAISSYDEITVRGRGNKIYSINKTKGYGTIKLSGYSQFVGGYIEVGDNKVYKVVEDMTIPVTEGTYKVIISKDGVMATRNITVSRDRTVLAEFEEYLKNPVKQGSIEFVISPDTAKLYIDGVKVNYNDLISLTYGIHTYTVVCNGYDNVISTFVVDSGYEKIEVIIDKNATKPTVAETESASDDTTKENTTEKAATQTENKTMPTMPTMPSINELEGTTSLSDVINQIIN